MVHHIGFDNRPLVQLKSQATPNGKKVITSEVVYLHTDHLNSPRIGTDTAGKVVWNWQSDAFGIKIPVANQPNKVIVNLRFPGQYYDMETGLYYNYHRYYDSQTGRYITSDPIGLSGGLNTYGYVKGNPLNRVDPLGLWGLTVPGTLPEGGVSCFSCHNSWLNPPAPTKPDGYEARQSKKSGKEKADDIPSWTRDYPPQGSNEDCKDYAARVLIQHYGEKDPRAYIRGAGSEYNKIHKNCERGC